MERRGGLVVDQGHGTSVLDDLVQLVVTERIVGYTEGRTHALDLAHVKEEEATDHVPGNDIAEHKEITCWSSQFTK